MNRRDALRVLGTTAAGIPLAVAGLARGAGAQRSAASAPNVLFIMTDDQRQDAMSAYGNAILRTPNMDRIGAGGIRFTESFSDLRASTFSARACRRRSDATDCRLFLTRWWIS